MCIICTVDSLDQWIAKNKIKKMLKLLTEPSSLGTQCSCVFCRQKSSFHQGQWDRVFYLVQDEVLKDEHQGSV